MTEKQKQIDDWYKREINWYEKEIKKGRANKQIKMEYERFSNTYKKWKKK